MKPTALVASLILALFALISGTIPARAADEKIWHVKAIHPEGRLLDVKALDKDGKVFAIKAFQEEGNNHLFDIKALVGEKKLPVKVLIKTAADTYGPVKAIGDDGTIYAIKALTPEGAKLDVKAVSESGNIIAIKAIGPKGEFFGVKALSPEGRVYDVKGVKLSKDPIEGKVNGVDFAAHIKAMPQAP
jgi:hypothetical protein